PSAWAGKRQSRLGRTGRFRVSAVTRAGLARMVDSQLVGQEGDILHILVGRGYLEELEERLVGGDSEGDA
ncbi:MAG: hypothetical protein ACRD0S_10970, partial [Acidimicrobiales bacterium]